MVALLRMLVTPGILAFAACAGTSAVPVVPPAASEPAVARPAQLPPAAAHALRSLLDCETAVEMRAWLAGAFTPSERKVLGYDQVTLDECIDRVAAAVLDLRQRPDDRRVHDRFADAMDLYSRSQREAMVRRSFGAASCLPQIR